MAPNEEALSSGSHGQMANHEKSLPQLLDCMSLISFSALVLISLYVLVDISLLLY